MLSVLGLAVIVTIYILLENNTYKWSLDAIKTMESSESDVLKGFCKALKTFGSQAPNVITVSVYIAMFKRRHQAFSYLILWQV